MRFSWLFVFVFLLAACTPQLSIKEHDLQDAKLIPEDANPTPIGFRRLKYEIPTGTTVASYGCNGLFREIVEHGGFAKQMGGADAKRVFGDTLRSQGYDVTGDPGFVFDEVEEEMRAVFSIGARITDIKMNICARRPWLYGLSKERGAGEITVIWTVFDMLNWKTVYKTTTQGYSKANFYNMEGVPLVLEEAFAVAAHNFGADPFVHDLLINGKLPPQKYRTRVDPAEETPGKYKADEEVVIDNKTLSKEPAAKRFAPILKTAVRVQTQGHGSGFFITKEGHILTNAHVVGYADRARIMMSGRRTKAIAEVLRVDRKRDVALLKLIDIPEGYEIHTLPIRNDIPEIGEQLYAIGAPLGKNMQDTVTKGIMSRYFYDKRRKQHYLQSDVTVHGGNSGGPLLDENGNIVGQAVLARTDGGIAVELNFFNPIKDVLKELDIHLE